MTFVFDHDCFKKAKRKDNPVPERNVKSKSFLRFVQLQRIEVQEKFDRNERIKYDIDCLRKTAASTGLEQRLSIKREILNKQKQTKNVMSVGEFDRKIIPLLDMYYSKGRDLKITDDSLIAVYNQDFLSDSVQPRIHSINMDFCSICNGEYVYSSEESMLYCVSCGYTTQYIDANSASIAYGDEIEYTSFSYKRINHLNEWLNHFQAKETTPVPDSVLSKIMNYLFEKRITDIKCITFTQIKKAQKYLGLRKYYDQTMQIWCRLTGRKPLRLDPICEEKIRLMFIRIQAPFDKHCPKTRKNFLSYPYCMYKFCQLLGYNYLLPYFSLLKGKDKLQLQEQIFDNICKDLGWEFVPIQIEQ